MVSYGNESLEQTIKTINDFLEFVKHMDPEESVAFVDAHPVRIFDVLTEIVDTNYYYTVSGATHAYIGKVLASGNNVNMLALLYYIDRAYGHLRVFFPAEEVDAVLDAPVQPSEKLKLMDQLVEVTQTNGRVWRKKAFLAAVALATVAAVSYGYVYTSAPTPSKILKEVSQIYDEMMEETDLTKLRKMREDISRQYTDTKDMIFEPEYEISFIEVQEFLQDLDYRINQLSESNQ